MRFRLGKNTSLIESSGTLPNMASTLDGWLQKMQFIKITKSTVNYKVVEVEEIIDFVGVWDGLPTHQLSVKTEGERSWKYYGIHASTALDLKPDDKILYLGERYRILSENDYSLYGYHFYEAVQDFTT